MGSGSPRANLSFDRLQNIIYGTNNSGTGSTVSAGNIAIGTTSPYSRLTVWGPDTATGTGAFVVSNSASTTEFTVFDNGNATLAGTLTQNSDVRLKTNIQTISATDTLGLINELNPVAFNWIDASQGSTTQMGFVAQDVQRVFPGLVATTSPTALTPDGTLGVNYIGFIAPIVSAIQQLYRELSDLAKTVANFAQSFTTQVLNAATGNFQKLCVTDGPSDQSPVCVTKPQLAALLSQSAASALANPSPSSSGTSFANPSPAGTPATTSSNLANPSPAATTAGTQQAIKADASVGSSTSSSVGAATSAPVIQVQGENPAHIHVGDTYRDLGATITGPQADLNLGLHTFVGSTPMNQAVIDTSAPATYHINYVATDSSGLTATSTRTVIVEAAPSATSTPSASTATSSTAQSSATTTNASSTAQ